MKQSISLLAILGLLVLSTGCSTVNEDQALQVQKSVEPAIATAVLFGIKSEPKVGPAMILVQETLETLIGVGTTEPSQIVSALSVLEVNMNDDTRVLFMSGLNTVLGIYTALVSDSVQEEISKQRWLALSLQTLYRGVSEGLAQARAANLID